MRGSNGSRRTYPALDYIVTVASDTPFIPFDLVQRFVAELEEHPALLVAASAEGVHPVVGLWPVELAAQLEDSLEPGNAKGGRLDQAAWGPRSILRTG